MIEAWLILGLTAPVIGPLAVTGRPREAGSEHHLICDGKGTRVIRALSRLAQMYDEEEGGCTSASKSGWSSGAAPSRPGASGRPRGAEVYKEQMAYTVARGLRRWPTPTVVSC